ncbi:MAG: hypothetical protein ACLQHS_09210 [Candidatus Limnocylindrales bacterium]
MSEPRGTVPPAPTVRGRRAGPESTQGGRRTPPWLKPVAIVMALVMVAAAAAGYSIQAGLGPVPVLPSASAEAPVTSPLAGASVAVASPAVTPAPAASPDLLADVAAVEAQVPPLRQLQPLWPVPTRIIDADQLRRTLEQEIDAPANVAAMSAEQGLLIRLGLAAPGLDLQALSLATLTSQVLGRVPSLGKMLGAGWTRAYLDTLGEVTFQVWLDQALEADAARQLAADWTGDQVVSWSGPSVGWVIAWRSTWVSVDSALALTSVADRPLAVAQPAGGSPVHVERFTGTTVTLLLASDRATLDRVSLGLGG